VLVCNCSHAPRHRCVPPLYCFSLFLPGVIWSFPSSTNFSYAFKKNGGPKLDRPRRPPPNPEALEPSRRSLLSEKADRPPLLPPPPAAHPKPLEASPRSPIPFLTGS
jgi:hypothetical protein